MKDFTFEDLINHSTQQNLVTSLNQSCMHCRKLIYLTIRRCIARKLYTKYIPSLYQSAFKQQTIVRLFTGYSLTKNISLLDPVQDFPLHTMLQFSPPHHQMKDFVNGVFWILLLGDEKRCVHSQCDKIHDLKCLTVNRFVELQHTCLVKSCMMLCSDTWEPMAKRLFSCFSMREIISWSSCVVNPSTPAYFTKYYIKLCSNVQCRLIQWPTILN